MTNFTDENLLPKDKNKNVLVIGQGGREHAICQAFKNSSQVEKIYIIPGNAGTKRIAENIDYIADNDFEKIANFCFEKKIDLVFIGPEQPLTLGIVDYLSNRGIAVFGPNQKSAQLEGSKVFMKKLASDNNIPTAQYQTFTEINEALKFINQIGFPAVIKTDGLASGKGVIIVENFSQAKQTIDEIFAGKFGEAGKKIIIEEFLTGFEVSYFVICDGKNFLPLGFVHDHKKVGENETGLNTGGMGTFSPSPFISDQLEQKIIDQIIRPTLNGLEKISCPYQGILFAGLMINNDQPKLLEFNIRFGDPETQVLLPRIKSDFYQLIKSAIDCKINQFKIEFFEQKKMVCVVICSNGYPEDYKKNIEIKDLAKIENDLPSDQSLQVLHAGTKEVNQIIYANGGRVLNIVSCAESFKKARQKAYQLIEKINWHEGFVRKDIAKNVD